MLLGKGGKILGTRRSKTSKYYRRLSAASRAAKFISISIVLLVWQLAGWPQVFNFPPKPRKAKAANIVVVLTSGATWTVPSDWNDSSNTIEAIGAGGNGADSSASANSGAGGGGGEYREAANVTLTLNATVNINIPSGGAGSGADGSWVENSLGSKVIEAMNGGNASSVTAGAGGTGGIGSAANFDGGGGGGGATGAEGSGGGGGGSAGPVGVGKAGAVGAGGTKTGGGGGGGSDGGSSTAGSSNSGTTGGSGGNGTGGTGGGGGGTTNGNNAGTGSSGGGGGGGGESTGSGIVPGAAGGSEDLWATGEGPSGGGGGGGGAGGTGASGDKSGGQGGTYGGGGGGAGFSGSHTFSGATGGQGIIVITYMPSVAPSITQANYRSFANPSGLGTTPWQDCRTEGGETTIPSGSSSSTVTLSQSISDMNQAFLLVNDSGDSSVTNGSDHMVAGIITDSSTLTFSRGNAASGVAQVGYSLIECFQNEFSVQRGQTTISSGNSSATASISAVDTSQSMVVISEYNDDASTTEQTGLATGALQDVSTVLLQRNGTPTINDTVDWQVITFAAGSGASVQTGETTLASGDASDTATINPVDASTSWLYCSWDADTDGLQADTVGCDLTDTSTLTFNRDSAKAYNNRIRWYVVTFPSGDVNVQRGAVSDGGGTTDGVRYDIEIPLDSSVSATTKAFPFITNTTSGTGAAFPRDDWIDELTNTSNLETSYWRGSSSGSGSHFWQVVDFLSPTADVGTPLAAQNTPAILTAAGRQFRLRMLLRDSSATLAQGTDFKLQYAALSGSCSASSYADVSGSTPIAYDHHSELSDGMALTANANDPVDGSNPTDTQSYVESNNFANSQSIISPGEDGEWDFSLADNGAPASTTYCFRIVNDDGSSLNAYSYYPEIVTSDGAFNVDIVDGSGNSVSNPTATLGAIGETFNCTTSTGTLGISSQRIRVLNRSADQAWALSIAATDGNTALWSSGSALYDFNDPSGSPPGCSAGADSDTYAGQLSLNFDSATVTAQSGCSTNGLAFGSDDGFDEGVTDALTVGAASASADNGCYWDLENIGLSQEVPGGQAAGDYSLSLTLTLVAD